MALTEAYIAGFFDGEGSVIASRINGRPMVKLCMSQNNLEVLEKIQEFLGYGRLNRSSRGHHFLRVNKQAHVRRLIRTIYPHSIVKRKQLKLAYTMAGTQDFDYRSELMARIRRLNRGPH